MRVAIGWKFSDRGLAVITESADATFSNDFYINLRRRQALKRGANRGFEEARSKIPDKGLD